MEIRIRQVRAEDAENVIKFSKIVGAETDNIGYGPEGIQRSAQELGQVYERIYQAEGEAVFLAEYDGEVVGMSDCSAYRSPRERHRGRMGIVVKNPCGIGVSVRN